MRYEQLDQSEIRQDIDATPEDVFAAWITPSVVEEWWGPEGFTTVVRRLEPVAGGRFEFEMTAPDGSTCSMTGVYTRVERPHCLVFEIEQHCNLCLPPDVTPFHGCSLVTVRFSESGRLTRVTVKHARLEPNYGRLAAGSWAGALLKLSGQIRRPG